MTLFDRFPPFLMAALGIALLTGMDAIVKQLNGAFGAFQIVFLRFAISAVLMAVLMVRMRYAWPRPHRLRAYLVRAALTLISTAAFFYALGHMKLAEVFALSLTAPVFASLFAALLLRERIQRGAALAIVAGLAGMVVIVSGGDGFAMGGVAPLALACALAAPITYALTVVLLRAQTAHEPVPVIVASQAALVAVMSSPVMAVEFMPPTWLDWGMFLALGVLGSVGHLALTSGIKRMSTIRYSVVEYTGLLWAAVLGYVVFAEMPRPTIWPGALLIITGCLLVARGRREKAAA